MKTLTDREKGTMDKLGPVGRKFMPRNQGRKLTNDQKKSLILDALLNLDILNDEQPDLDPETIKSDFLGVYHDYCEAARIVLSNGDLFRPVVKNLKVKELGSITQYLSSSLIGGFFSELGDKLPEDFAYTSSEEELFFKFVNTLVDHYSKKFSKNYPGLIPCERRLKVAVGLNEALDNFVLEGFEDNNIVSRFVGYIKDGVIYIIGDGLDKLGHFTTNPELNEELIAKGYIPST